MKLLNVIISNAAFILLVIGLFVLWFLPSWIKPKKKQRKQYSQEEVEIWEAL